MDENLQLLCEAVLKQAVKDLECAYRYHDERTAETLERFIMCEDESPIPAFLYGDKETGKYIIERVKNKVYGKNNKRNAQGS